jgi:hypothetical protein
MAEPDVFVDTSGFLALWDATDSHHTSAVRLQAELARNHRRFLTTDYVVDETATLLLVRHSHAAAADFLQTVSRSEALQLEWVSQTRFDIAVGLFCRYADKQWSFTDCLSFTVMRELKIHDSFTADHHFRQAGFSALLGG